MQVRLRPGTPKDAAACGLIDFEAFKTLASHHNFPWDFPSPEVAISVVTIFLLLEGRGSKEALCAAQAVGLRIPRECSSARSVERRSCGCAQVVVSTCAPPPSSVAHVARP